MNSKVLVFLRDIHLEILFLGYSCYLGLFWRNGFIKYSNSRCLTASVIVGDVFMNNVD